MGSQQTRSGSGQGSMQGMDHGNMAATGGARRSGRGEMAGMDHGQMAGMNAGGNPGGSGRPAQEMNHGNMAGMDHGQMQSTQGRTTGQGGMQGMQHGNMPGMQGQAGTRANMPGMQHAAGGMPNDPGTRKLLTLVGDLVQDPVVQRRIQADPELREDWQDPGVRRIVTGQP